MFLACTAAAGLAAYGLPVTWAPVLIAASVAQVVLVVWSLADAPITKAQRRRARRRLPGWLR